MKKVDMSEQAVLRRLKMVDQLRELCLSLMKARKLTPEEAEVLKKKRAENAFKTSQNDQP